MEKTEFKSETFKYSLIVYIITLLCWNLYTLTIGFSNAIFPIIIQGILLFLILSKYKQAKIGIKIWSLILIFSYGISLLAKLVKIFLNDEIIISELIIIN